MDYLPVNLDLRGKKCLVVGGGPETAAKVPLLKSCGAAVRWIKKGFSTRHLKDCHLVVAGGADESLVRRVSAECQKRGILINAVDRPKWCSFIFPAILASGPLTVAVGTSGQSPALARLLRDELQSKIGNEYKTLLKIAGKARPKIKKKFTEQKARFKAFRALANKRVLGMVRRGKLRAVHNLVKRLLK